MSSCFGVRWPKIDVKCITRCKVTQLWGEQKVDTKRNWWIEESLETTCFAESKFTTRLDNGFNMIHWDPWPCFSWKKKKRSCWVLIQWTKTWQHYFFFGRLDGNLFITIAIATLTAFPCHRSGTPVQKRGQEMPGLNHSPDPPPFNWWSQHSG